MKRDYVNVTPKINHKHSNRFDDPAPLHVICARVVVGVIGALITIGLAISPLFLF